MYIHKVLEISIQMSPKQTNNVIINKLHNRDIVFTE